MLFHIIPLILSLATTETIWFFRTLIVNSGVDPEIIYWGTNLYLFLALYLIFLVVDYFSSLR